MWTWQHPVKLVFGVGALAQIETNLEQQGLQSGVVIASPSAVRSGAAQQVCDQSGGRVQYIISDLAPNPSVQNVRDCARKAKEAGAKFIVAIGGGSAMDCAKAVCAVLAMDCDPMELMDGRKVTAAFPLVAIPTTAGSGSEVSPGSVLSDPGTERKLSVSTPLFYPVFAIIDPALTYSCPRRLTAVSGLDALMHSLDALGSVKATEMTDMLAIEGARLCFASLTKAVEQADEAARKDMMLASVLGAMAFSHAGTTGSHATSYLLTAHYHIDHGEACAFTGDAWWRLNAAARPVLEDYSKRLGFASADALADEINVLKKRFGMCMTLGQAGIALADLEEVAKAALAAGNMPNNVAKPGLEGIIAFLTEKA